MRDTLAVIVLAMLILGAAFVALPRASATSPASDENPYPDVNPCASGVSDISGTIKVCTLIRVGENIEVMTHPLRAMVWIQISATGPTAHVSDTLNGIAWVQDSEGIGLTQRDDWFVAIQSWNLPPDVELLPPIRYNGVRPDEARTFVFNCLGESCDRLAASPTPTITSRPPNATREPTFTPTITPTTFLTPTATVPVTGTETVTPTVAPTVSVTPAGSPTITVTTTATLTPVATVTGTLTPLPTASITATVSATPPLSVTRTATPTVVYTPTETMTATRTLTPTIAASATPPGTVTPSPSATTNATATEHSRHTATPAATRAPGYKVYIPFVRRPR